MACVSIGEAVLSWVVARSVQEDAFGKLELLLCSVVDVDVELLGLFIHDSQGEILDVDTEGVASFAGQGQGHREARRGVLDVARDLVPRAGADVEAGLDRGVLLPQRELVGGWSRERRRGCSEQAQEGVGPHLEAGREGGRRRKR